MITVEQVKQKTPERFWSKVKFSDIDECWEWNAATYKGCRYGAFLYARSNGKRNSGHAHRFMFISLFGDLPTHIHVLHKCDNPICCNPNHLFSGTNLDNILDRVAKGRSSKWIRPFGSKHHGAKLTESKVIEIYKKLKSGMRTIDLSKEYHVSEPTIQDIKHGRTWIKLLQS